MAYLDDYHEIVKKENLGILGKIFTDIENDVEVPYGIKKVNIKRTASGLPYIHLSVDYYSYTIEGDPVGARLMIINIDFQEYFSKEFKFLNKLPVIAVPYNLPGKIRKLMNISICLEHEIIHLNQFIDLYQEDPEFQIEQEVTDFDQCWNPDSLKLFTGSQLSGMLYREFPAHVFSYNCGERTIFDYISGNFIHYPAENKTEYIRYSLLKYIESLERGFTKRASELGTDKAFFRKEFNRTAVNIYGFSPYKKYREMLETRKTFSTAVCR